MHAAASNISSPSISRGEASSSSFYAALSYPPHAKTAEITPLDPSLSNTMHLDIPSPFFLFFTTSTGAAPFICPCKTITTYHALPKFIGPLIPLYSINFPFSFTWHAENSHAPPSSSLHQETISLPLRNFPSLMQK